MTQKVELMLIDPERPREAPRKVHEFETSIVPLQGQTITWNERVFAVLGHAFALVEGRVEPTGVQDVGLLRPATLDVALVVQQVGGPPMLLASRSPLQI